VKMELVQTLGLSTLLMVSVRITVCGLVLAQFVMRGLSTLHSRECGNTPLPPKMVT